MSQIIQLTLHEQRVIGCLIEKSLTTPDQYPLSLNALTNACNQKSNREPVLSLTESEVQNTVDLLIEKRVVFTQSSSTSRVEKYKHRFCNTEFSDLQFSAQELGVICVLLLRGPQTPGELRTRTNRLCQFSGVQEVEETLNELCSKAIVIKLDREPGRRESRYAHCFSEITSDKPIISNEAVQESQNVEGNETNERLLALEEQVELMQMMIDELQQRLDDLVN
ncbi:YceH family protein [Aliikangiella sp. IMCC44359]|uniref:YceH family protein n=1 Tax=Aliikangiella sp. IMCC44359 TaxID=3459125 RepID=UPI00403AF428